MKSVTNILCFTANCPGTYVTHCYSFDGKAICHNHPSAKRDGWHPTDPRCQVSASAAARRFASRSGSTCFFFARSGAAARIERCNPWPRDLWGLRHQCHRLFVVTHSWALQSQLCTYTMSIQTLWLSDVGDSLTLSDSLWLSLTLSLQQFPCCCQFKHQSSAMWRLPAKSSSTRKALFDMFDMCITQTTSFQNASHAVPFNSTCVASLFLLYNKYCKLCGTKQIEWRKLKISSGALKYRVYSMGPMGSKLKSKNAMCSPAH